MPVTAANALLMSCSLGGFSGPPSHAAFTMPLSIRLAKAISLVPKADIKRVSSTGEGKSTSSGIRRADLTRAFGACGRSHLRRRGVSSQGYGPWSANVGDEHGCLLVIWAHRPQAVWDGNCSRAVPQPLDMVGDTSAKGCEYCRGGPPRSAARFSLRTSAVRCRFGEGTFASTHGNGQDAP